MDVHCCRWFTCHQSKLCRTVDCSSIPSCINLLRGISALSLIGDLSLKGGMKCNHAAPGTKQYELRSDAQSSKAEYHSKELLPTLWSRCLHKQGSASRNTLSSAIIISGTIISSICQQHIQAPTCNYRKWPGHTCTGQRGQALIQWWLQDISWREAGVKIVKQMVNLLQMEKLWSRLSLMIQMYFFYWSTTFST